MQRGRGRDPVGTKGCYPGPSRRRGASWSRWRSARRRRTRSPQSRRNGAWLSGRGRAALVGVVVCHRRGYPPRLGGHPGETQPGAPRTGPPTGRSLTECGGRCCGRGRRRRHDAGAGNRWAAPWTSSLQMWSSIACGAPSPARWARPRTKWNARGGARGARANGCSPTAGSGAVACPGGAAEVRRWAIECRWRAGRERRAAQRPADAAAPTPTAARRARCAGSFVSLESRVPPCSPGGRLRGAWIQAAEEAARRPGPGV